MPRRRCGETFDAILVNAGVTHPLDSWLDALTPDGRMVLPLTVPMPAMGATLGKGLVMALTGTPGGDLPARVLTLVAIYTAEGIRDEALSAAIGAAMMGGPAKWSAITRLRRDPHEADPSCWLHARPSASRRAERRQVDHNRGMPHLFDPLRLRELTLANRIVVSPMCQYSSVDGFANDWHFVHLGSRAVGGAALVFTEATAVTADGRISPQDLGIWDDAHVDGLARIVALHPRAGERWPGCSSRTPGARRARRGRGTAGGAVAPSDGGWQPVGPTGRAVRRQLSGAARADARRDPRDRRRLPRRRRGARSTPASTSSRSTRRTAI